MEELHNNYRLNDHTLGFNQQTQNLGPEFLIIPVNVCPREFPPKALTRPILATLATTL